jgi:hypothetical protein
MAIIPLSSPHNDTARKPNNIACIWQWGTSSSLKLQSMHIIAASDSPPLPPTHHYMKEHPTLRELYPSLSLSFSLNSCYPYPTLLMDPVWCPSSHVMYLLETNGYVISGSSGYEGVWGQRPFPLVELVGGLWGNPMYAQ